MMNVKDNLLIQGDVCYHVQEKHIPFLIVPSFVRVITDHAGFQASIARAYIPRAVETIGFKGMACSGLEELYFEEYSMLTRIGYGAFYGNDLKYVELPESVVDLGEQVFAQNPELQLHIRNLFTRGLLGCGAHQIFYQDVEITSSEQLRCLQKEYVEARVTGNVEEVLLQSRLSGFYHTKKLAKIYSLKKI